MKIKEGLFKWGNKILNLKTLQGGILVRVGGGWTDIDKYYDKHEENELNEIEKYGIISVLAQLFYTTTYLFTVPPEVFNPPPKVNSAVIQMVRKEDFSLDCDESLLFKIVKLSFQQRRKTLRNSLKTLNLSDLLREDVIFDLRPEKLSGVDFIQLTKRIGHGNISN